MAVSASWIGADLFGGDAMASIGLRESGKEKRRPSPCRPALEALEDRLLLSGAALPNVEAQTVALTANTGTIHGTLFDDLAGTGLYSPGDPVLAGRTVFLDLNRDGKLDGREPSTQTAANGSYVFHGLTPGTYVVCQVLPAGWAPSSYRVVASVGPASAADHLIGLDRFRADPRFAGIYGQGESVVILDSGIDPDNAAFGPDVNHDGIADAVVYQRDFVNGNSSAPDRDGHGTFVASLIGSRNPEYLGVAPGVNIIVLKVLDSKGNGEFSNIDRALRWVLANAAAYHIVCVNMSFGDGDNWTKEQSLYGIGGDLAALAAHDVTVVGAAGNDYHGSKAMPGLSYPSSDPNVIPVGAVWDADHGGPWLWQNGDRDNTTGPDHIVSFSQRLPGSGEVFAPGTMLTGATPGGGTTTLSGTSMAAAVVSGLVALAQQLAIQKLGHSLSVAQIRILLNSTGVPIRDGTNESDNVGHTWAIFHRADAFALGQAILAMKSSTLGIAPGEQLVALGKGTTVGGVNLSSFQLGQVSGVVFQDINANGKLDTGEKPLAGRLVFADFNGDGKREAGEPFTYTDLHGRYTLTGLGPGVVDIRVGLTSGEQQTTPPVRLAVFSGLNRVGVNQGIEVAGRQHARS
jgi:subtilisin family serine protease